MRRVILTLFFILICSSMVLADIGVGISPSRIVLQIEAGKTYTQELLIFNSGDNALTINIGAEGQIKDLTKITPTSINVVPEPKPQALPIKNGKTVSVEFSVPLISMTKVYTGTITATGSPSGGSMLGGGVGVATQVEIRVVPPKSALSPINPTYLLIAVAVLAMIIIIVMLKRSGFRIKIEKKSRK